MPVRRKAVAAIGGAGLVAAALSIAATPSVATAAVNSATIAYGVVTAPDGHPVRGAEITLIANPYPMPSSGDVRLHNLDTTFTDINGHYIVNLPAGYDGSGEVDPATGLITFDVLVDSSSPNIHTMTSVQADVNGNQPATQQRTNFVGKRPVMGVTTRATAATTDPSTDTAQFTEIEPEPAVTSYPDTTPVPNADGSSYSDVTVVKDYGRRWTVVGQWFSNATAVQGDFRYTSGASSSLGIGISGSGDKGTFSAGGTTSKSSSSSVSFPAHAGTGGWLERSTYHYKLFKYFRCDKACLPPRYEAEPTAYGAGADTASTGTWRPSGITQCVTFENGSAFDKHSSTAIEWTNGVQIHGPIGIDLSIRTGYETDADLHVAFNGRRKLCGRNDPGATPYVLMARPL